MKDRGREAEGNTKGMRNEEGERKIGRESEGNGH